MISQASPNSISPWSGPIISRSCDIRFSLTSVWWQHFLDTGTWTLTLQGITLSLESCASAFCPDTSPISWSSCQVPLRRGPGLSMSPSHVMGGRELDGFHGIFLQNTQMTSFWVYDSETLCYALVQMLRALLLLSTQGLSGSPGRSPVAISFLLAEMGPFSCWGNLSLIRESEGSPRRHSRTHQGRSWAAICPQPPGGLSLAVIRVRNLGLQPAGLWESGPSVILLRSPGSAHILCAPRLKSPPCAGFWHPPPFPQPEPCSAAPVRGGAGLLNWPFQVWTLTLLKSPRRGTIRALVLKTHPEDLRMVQGDQHARRTACSWMACCDSSVHQACFKVTPASPLLPESQSSRLPWPSLPALPLWESLEDVCNEDSFSC